MEETEEPKPAPFDAEWEIQKMRGRFTDILNMIEELKAKDRTLSARISRLRLKSLEAEEDEEPDETAPEGPRFEDMTVEERALLYSELLDKLDTNR